MDLSTELISQFVKITNDKTETKKETTVYGTTVEHNGTTYVKIDGSELLTPVTSTASTKPGERVTVMIKNHMATITGNISSPSARTEDLQNVANSASNSADKITEFEIALGHKAEVEELRAESARIDTLTADNVTIKQTLASANAEIDTLQANEVTINQQLTAHKASIETLETTKLSAEIAEATYATIKNLEATNADVNNLRSTYGDFVILSTDKFEAIEAEIAKLEAGEISVEQLKATFATIVQLEAEQARITDLEAEVGDIDTLIFGSATGSTIQTSFANAVIAQLGAAQIKSAMIESITAGKITSGDIITDKVRIKSEDGKLLISDQTIQISDSNRARVQIGKDASNDYSINIWDASGNLMFSKGGITDSAIKSAIIRNDMVSDTANIAAHKLDIDSLFEEINGSTNTIKSTKVLLDEEGQTLDVAFTALTTDVSDVSKTVTSQGTAISTMQGQIANKIWQQDITAATDELGGEIDALSTKYTTVEQKLDGVTTTVADHTSQISKKADSTTVTAVSDRVTTVETDLEGFKTNVSNTYATKTDLTDLEIGGRNLALGTTDEWSGWITPGANANNQTHVAKYAYLSDIKEVGDKYAVSIEIEFSGVKAGTGGNFLFRAQGAVDDSWTPSNIWSTGLMNFTTAPGDGVYRYTAVVRINESNVDCTKFACGFRADYWNGTGKYRYRKIKVEKGGKATDWTPAPEDMATGADVESLTNRVTTTETSISENAKEITLRATKSEVENIAIGGRNLIRDSKLDKKTDMWSYDYAHETVSFENGYLEVSRVEDPSYTGRTFNSQYHNVNPLLLPDEISGKTYVLSAELKAIDGIPAHSGSSVFWRVNFDNSGNYEELTLTIPADLSSTEWRRCWVAKTFGTHNWTNSQIAIALQNADNGVCVRNIMLERATKPSMWTPATEDVETRVASAEASIAVNAQGITQLASRTSDNEKSIATLELTADGLTSRLSTTEKDVETAQDAADAAQSTADAAQSTADAAKKQLYHSASGTSGTAGYVGICQLKVSNNYQNRPILFELSNRGQQSSNVSLCFNNSNSTDPGIYHLQRDGGINVWAYKVSTSTWHIIAQKSEGHDTIYVKDFSNTNGSVAVTWVNVHYSSLPTSDITEAVLLAGKLAKSVVDNAAKTATNYLDFSTAGLVVGDHTAGTLKKNVSIDSDSVDIRDGSTVMASFGADKIELGKHSRASTIDLCNGTGMVRADTYDPVTNSSYSAEGLFLESDDRVVVDSKIVRLNSDNRGDSDAGYNQAYLSNYVTEESAYVNIEAVNQDTTNGSTYFGRFEARSHDLINVLGMDAAENEPYAMVEARNASYLNRFYMYPTFSRMTQKLLTTGGIISKGNIVIGSDAYGEGGRALGVNKTLWSGTWYMNADQTATLSEAVSVQPNGIVLVFSEYIDGAVSNTAFHTFFVPKQVVASHAGVGHCLQMTSSNLAYFATKYLYISDTKIVGNDNNTLTGASTSGITRSCNRFVMRYVIGV